MEELNEIQDKHLKNKIILRKIVGWIIFGLGIIYLVNSIFFLIGGLSYLLIFGALLSMIAGKILDILFIAFLLLMILGISFIILSVLHLKAGLCMARGKKKDFVMVILFLFATIILLGFLGYGYYNYETLSTETIWNFLEVSPLFGLYVFFIIIMKYSWDTFQTKEDEKKEEGSTSKVEKKAIIYTKEYTLELEEERRRVQSTQEKVVSANGYDFSSISGGR
jgi:hypothetical protein